MTADDNSLVSLTAEIVSAHVVHNTVAVSDLPALISGVYASLAGLGGADAPTPVEPQQPAVSIRASIKPGYLVCLEDGKQMKMLKRHLMTDHQLTPAAYRAKWQLLADYPMVAANYAAERRTLAMSIGLGNCARRRLRPPLLSSRRPRQPLLCHQSRPPPKHRPPKVSA